MAVLSYQYMMLSNKVTPVMGMSYFTINGVLFVSFLLMALHTVKFIFDDLNTLKRGKNRSCCGKLSTYCNFVCSISFEHPHCLFADCLGDGVFFVFEQLDSCHFGDAALYQFCGIFPFAGHTVLHHGGLGDELCRDKPKFACIC